jgi:iron(III) transport system permease protein
MAAKQDLAGATTALPWSRWMPSGGMLVAATIAALVLVPIAVVLAALVSPDAAVWQHLAHYVLPELIRNTLWLVFGVAVGVTLLGVSLAWLTAVCDFPGRALFTWTLALPLALPAYVLAFVFIGLLDFAGPLQTLLRSTFGDIALPSIRSRGGVILVMTLALYPYVYLITRNAFLTQGRKALEAAQVLGYSRPRAFFAVALPMARPWIAGGVMLAVMETLADFGTVAIFNYDTFTTGIYKAWYGLFSLPAASQLASLLVIVVFALVLIEQYLRQRKRYTSQWRAGAARERIVLRGPARWAAAGYCALVVLVAFVVPVVQLVLWTWSVAATDLDARYFEFVWHSLLLGVMAAVLTVLVALILSYAARSAGGVASTALTRVATLGYALPGPVLAVGTFIPIAWLDQHLADLLQRLTQADAGQILQGTLLTMLVAYCVRFLAVAFNPVDGNMQRITRSIDDAARSMGVAGWRMILRVHAPILRSGLVTAALLVFVDVMKEMPITLMTRPFGWDTLAIRIFEMTSEGQWERAALPALALSLAGLIPIMLLTRFSER